MDTKSKNVCQINLNQRTFSRKDKAALYLHNQHRSTLAPLSWYLISFEISVSSNFVDTKSKTCAKQICTKSLLVIGTSHLHQPTPELSGSPSVGIHFHKNTNFVKFCGHKVHKHVPNKHTTNHS